MATTLRRLVCVFAFAAVAALPGRVLASGAAPKAPFQDAELRVRIGNYWTMRLAAYDGTWQPVTRAKPSFQHVDYGYVTASKGTPEQFSVSMQLRRDHGPRSGGHVFYDMTFTRGDDGTYTGAFTETAGGSRSTGEIAAFVAPPQPRDEKDREPVASGEHPRLLMRKSDVPALREKLQTPLGKAFLARAKDATDPVLLGVLYQATGEKHCALDALKIVQNYADIDGNAALTGNVGHQIVRVALTIDLCYDAWPVKYRDELLRQIKARLPKRQYDLTISHANYNQVSNYYGPGFGSAGIASLLLHRMKGPAPDEPVKPLCVRFDGCRVPPLKDYTPPQGVPVVPLVDDELPKDWIYAGGLKPGDGPDPLKPLGGPEKARPMPGDEVSDGNKTVRFAPVSHEKDKGYYEWGNRRVLDVTNAIGGIYHSESYFYTVIRNEKPGWYEFNIGPDHRESRTYLNGVEIREGELVQLDKGLYTIFIRVNIGQTEPWGREMLAARFTAVRGGKVKKRTIEEINAELRADYEQAMAFWKTELAEWKARDGEDLDVLRMFHKGREQMYQHLRFGVGDGGFQAEVAAYGNIAAYYPLFYATCFRTAMGRDVSTYPDATHVLPRQLMQTAFVNGRPVIMPLNVKAHFDPRWCANYFPLVPEAYRPHVLWAWARTLGAEPGANPNAETAGKLLGSLNGQTLATTFVNYPLELTPKHPNDGMPRTWSAETLGFYVFRNGWRGGDEFIAQVFTKSIPIRAWSHPNAGAFRLWGLGRPWTAAPIERSGYRPEESVVILPNDVTYDSTSGRVVHHRAETDGSGALSVDLADVYLAVLEKKERRSDLERLEDDLDALSALDDKPKSELELDTAVEGAPDDLSDYFDQKDRSQLRRKLPKLYNWYAERFPDVDMTSHVDGERAFAFDYSGKSGAPLLMAMVDTVRGGKTKQWHWHLPAGEDVSAEVKGNTFTLRYPDATLRGTFISPAKIRPRFLEKQKFNFIYRGGSKKGTIVTREFDFIAAETDAKDATFFVVITVQRGEAPAVKTTGSGADAVVTVGGQTIRLRDGKIVIGSRE